MGHKDIKTTMIYVDIAKPHIQEQVAKLDRIPLPPPLFTRPNHLAEPGVGENYAFITLHNNLDQYSVMR